MKSRKWIYKIAEFLNTKLIVENNNTYMDHKEIVEEIIWVNIP